MGGLAQRLVQDGLLDETAMQDAIVRSKEKRVSLVTHLVASSLATARDIAISASNEFGVPLLDLDAVAPDMEAIRAVSEKLLQKHRVLPLKYVQMLNCCALEVTERLGRRFAGTVDPGHAIVDDPDLTFAFHFNAELWAASEHIVLLQTVATDEWWVGDALDEVGRRDFVCS